MTHADRIARLETLALNQTLIIEHLTGMVRCLVTPEVREHVLDTSAEDLLQLMYVEGLPLELLEPAIAWRQSVAMPGIMQISG